MILRKFIAFMVIIATALPMFAVTDKEMEEARTITAQAYLRYANDGSGYLDALSPKTMQELTASLKEKEKENLKAFNSVAVPKDYASWDKAKLTEFWAVTFFTSPSLSAKGKIAKARVRKKIQAMTIAAPASAEAQTPASPTQPADPQPAETPTTPEESQAVADAVPDGASPAEDILADQKAIEEDAAEAGRIRKEESNMWVYIVVLVILVGVVIWLVVIAANMMKRTPSGEENGADADAVREKARAAIAKKNTELAALQNRAADAEELVGQLRARIADLEQENTHLTERYEALRAEMNNAAAKAAAAVPTTAPKTPAPKPAPVAKPAPVSEFRPATAKPQLLRDIYLGRANARGQFVRADRALTPGHSLFHLHTDDGLVGSFTLVDSPDAIEMALDQPIHFLAGGCTGADFSDTSEVTAIETLSPGTAIFENGCWRVLRKTTIRFE